jgi:hypothetical protein
MRGNCFDEEDMEMETKLDDMLDPRGVPPDEDEDLD